ncbi:MAG: RlpA-like double-psi beta-barrel domain-containing protein [Actinomycetota bacterium]
MDRLSAARQDQAMALATVTALRSKLPALETRLESLQKASGQATIGVIQDIRDQQAAERELATARETLDARARAAFEVGPATALEAMLGARTLADLSAADEYASRMLEQDSSSLDDVRNAEADLAKARAEAETEQKEALRRETALSAQVDGVRTQLDEAIGRAREAGLRVHDLARQVARLRTIQAAQQARQATVSAAQQARQATVSAAQSGSGSGPAVNVDPTWFDGRNQDELLALLGPDGGRTCTIPPGLKNTGQQIAGDASWYGWDFAGQSTASGATFDPRLMTAANRTFPFGTFLRVRWQDRCVIVLVNDRGPYGNLDRVIDLSLGAAQALGSDSAGVVPVTADVLVPR